jgi:hypothetical protein
LVISGLGLSCTNYFNYFADKLFEPSKIIALRIYLSTKANIWMENGVGKRSGKGQNLGLILVVLSTLEIGGEQSW